MLLLGSNVSPSWSNNFQEALTAYRAGDYAAAFRLWMPYAKKGEAPAQYNIAQMYRRALGVPQDLKEAMRWYKLAANQGYRNAQHNLGVMYRNGESERRDLETAVKWFQRAAQQGYAPSQFNLGLAYAKGEGAEKNPSYAYMWWSIAALSGHENATKNKKIIEKFFEPADLSKAKRLARKCVLNKLEGCTRQIDFVILTTQNIYEGMVVYRNPNWNDAWGKKDIHPPTGESGKVRSWSDMNGKLHGRYQGDERQLGWPGLVCIDWSGKNSANWKSRQAYRIGFAKEYWLVGEASH